MLRVRFSCFALSPILAARAEVEKPIRAAYNSLDDACWPKLRRGIRKILPVQVIPLSAAAGLWSRKKERLNGLRNRRAVHRHQKPRGRGRLPGGLHPPAQGRAGL